MKAWPAAYIRCTVGLETSISGKMTHEKGVGLYPSFGRDNEVCTEEAGVTFSYFNVQSSVSSRNPMNSIISSRNPMNLFILLYILNELSLIQTTFSMK